MVLFGYEIVQEQANAIQLSGKTDFTRSGSGRAARLEKEVITLSTYKTEIDNNGSVTRVAHL